MTDTAEASDEFAADTLSEGAAAQNIIRMLANRDEALIEMARLAITRPERLQVSADARRLLGDIRRESNRLLGIMRGEYHLTHQPMITPGDQASVDSLQSVGMGEFDAAFLRIVARHAEEDVKLIERALPEVENERLREFLTQVREQRARDAAAFRKRMGG